MSAPAKRVLQQPVGERPKSKAEYESTFKPKFEAKPDDVLIHVRFHPNAEVAWIGIEPPENVSWKDLYTHLRMEAFDYYRTLAGGRGFFRIPRETYGAIISRL